MGKLLGLCMLGFSIFLSGCADNAESSNSIDFELGSEEVATDISALMQVNDLNVRMVGTLTYAIGSITNNSDRDVDSICDMAMFDKQGNLIKVGKFNLNVGVGQTVYFDELVGNNLLSGLGSVSLQNVD